MALFHSHFFSETLGMQTEALVILPQAAPKGQIAADAHTPRTAWPCLWLLHGLTGDHTVWHRRTSIERYADDAGIAVVMPNAHRSFYCDMVRGGNYWTHLTEEIPSLMRSFFPLSPHPRHNAVAGLSMGGYGAAKWLLRHPASFLAGVSLSGALDIAGLAHATREEETDPVNLATLASVFGNRDPTGSTEDLFALASQLGPNAPPLLQICGTEDYLYPDNLRFRDHARQTGLPLEYREAPGEHNWSFWDREIQTAIAWLLNLGFAS